MSNHISKRHQISWKEYVNDLIDSSRKFAYLLPTQPKHHCMTEIEQHELGGYLLRQDIESQPEDLAHNLVEILEQDDYYFADLLATYCISDSPDNGGKLLDHLRKIVANHYKDKMQEILTQKEEKNNE